jgi:hypothetical protein
MVALLSVPPSAEPPDVTLADGETDTDDAVGEPVTGAADDTAVPPDEPPPHAATSSAATLSRALDEVTRRDRFTGPLQRSAV